MAQTKVQLLQPDLGDVIDFDASTLFVDGADNRIGIRNTNPQYELDVTGTVNATNFRGNISVGTIDDWITHTGDTDTKIGFSAADTFQVYAGGGPRLTVNSTGLQVPGIVDTTVLRRQVQNSSVIIAGGNATNDGANIAMYGSAHSSQAGNFEFRSSGTYLLKIRSDGDIVTQNLTATSFNNDQDNTKILEITGDGTVGEYGQINLSGNQNTHGNAVGVIKFINRENAHSSSGSGATSRSLGAIEMRASTDDSNAGDDSGGYFRFVLKGDGSGNAERLRIKGNGSIYTVTQGAKFGISQDPELTTMGNTSGTWQVPEVDGSTIGAEMRIGDHNTNSTAVIRLASYGSGDGGVGGGAIMFTNTRCGSAIHHSDLAAIKGARESLGKGYLRFFTASQAANTEKMRITSAGDVGIGTINPQSNFAAGTTTTKFAVVTQPNVEGSFHETAHFSAGGDDGETGAIVRIGQHENDRGLYIKAGQASSDRATARFGLRNSSATDTDVLTLYQDSTNYRVGIGINNPAEKLDVSGAVQASGGFKTAGHPVVTYASFTDISGGSYATRLGSTGTSTLRSTQIYGGGSHIATFDGVNKRLGINITAPLWEVHAQKSTGTTTIGCKNTGGNATVYIEASNTNTAKLELTEAGTGSYSLQVGDANALKFFDDSTERMRITSNGWLEHGKRFSGSSTVDTGIYVGQYGNYGHAVFEVIVAGNPNHFGSGAYAACSTYILSFGCGWDGVSQVSTRYRADRIGYGDGGSSNNSQVTATFHLWDGTTERSSGATANTSNQLRIKIVGSSTAAYCRCYIKMLSSIGYLN